ncbi:hypothetical protein ACF052_05910 [Streptomyces pilosus]|uniref:hypothetical protein n=1 Tax=Streptomyces pilosus TaxID=28893 RepID=UPI0036FE2398
MAYGNLVIALAVAGGGCPPGFDSTRYICGFTDFAETAAGLLVAPGHHPGRIRTERFGWLDAAGMDYPRSPAPAR